jgi:prolyl oligopeptidase
VWFAERLDFFNGNLWLGNESNAGSKLDLPTDVWMQAHRDWLVVKLRTAWSAGGHSFAPDTVLSISLSAFVAGARNFAVLFEAGPRRAIQGFFWSADKLVVSILDELRPVFEVWTPSANGWTHTK